MSTTPHNEIDDYIAGLPEAEQQEVAIAGIALDLAQLLFHLRQERGLSQTAAAARAGMRQQAVSRLEKAVGNVQLATLQRYLTALGYRIDIVIKDNDTGTVIGTASLAP